MENNIVEIYDTTLRDGAQGEGISFTTLDKLAVLQELDHLSISYIEGGNPASNPRDMEFFEQASSILLKHSTLVAFGATRRAGQKAEDDISLKALLHANTKVVTIFGKSSKLHVQEVLQVSLEENLQMITDTISFLVKNKKQVFFDAEHFFDGYKQDSQYALSCLESALKAGACRIVLCDTNGGCFPNEIGEIIKKVKAEFPNAKIGIHCHNDVDCAVANSIMAVKSGAIQVQGTYLGFGERCGNTNLSAVIPSLQIKMGYSCIQSNALSRLTQSARLIAEIANVGLPNSMPYIGKSAFAHKGGMHVDGVMKTPFSFEHITPSMVGNERSILLSDMAGRSALLSVLQGIDKSLQKDSPKTKEMVSMLKELEAKGYVFESANASLILMLRKSLNCFSPFFELKRFKVIGEQENEGKNSLSVAMIKLSVNSQSEISAAEGDGPVHALDLALKKAVERFYPCVSKMRLTDYKVRVIEPSDATAALVRVLITSSDGKDIWTTVGVSRDIIEASLNALTDSVEYKLLLEYGNMERIKKI